MSTKVTNGRILLVRGIVMVLPPRHSQPYYRLARSFRYALRWSAIRNAWTSTLLNLQGLNRASGRRIPLFRVGHRRRGEWAFFASVSLPPNFNGTAGGISQTASIYGIDPGSGTGGVTITSINGVPTPAITINLAASTIDFFTPLSVRVTVEQFEGQPEPSGTVTLTSGAYTSTAATLDSNGTATVNIPAGSLALGSEMLTLAYTPAIASATTYSQSWASASVTVNPASPQIVFARLPVHRYMERRSAPAL